LLDEAEKPAVLLLESGGTDGSDISLSKPMQYIARCQSSFCNTYEARYSFKQDRCFMRRSSLRAPTFTRKS